MRDYIKQPLEVLSYGGGTQSTAMLILIKQGKLPKPDLVLHADTGSEMPETIEFLEIAEKICNEINVPFKVVTSHKGALHDDYMRLKAIPIIGVRSCTANFKILPQRRYLRSIVGKGKGKVLANMWLGITTDEARRRVEKSDVIWTGLKYPLLDVYPLTRKEAIKINEDAGLKVGKSGCFCCPYAGSAHWHSLKDNHPELFAIAIEMETIKENFRGKGRGLQRKGKLSDLLNQTSILDWVEDSNCDTGGGCFL
jgi:3'-phosphoadenosine 5'-phosphosulfate sulfotransferase (PAPS reductase)/FAD synthetase